MADNITEKPMAPKTVAMLTGYLLLAALLTAYLIVSLWPSQRPLDTGKPSPPDCPAASTGSDQPPLKLRSIHPPSVSVGTVGDVVLLGCEFTVSTVAKVNGTERHSQFVDANHIRIGLVAGDVSAVGTVVLTLSEGVANVTDTLNVQPPAISWHFLGMGPWSIHPEVQLLLLVLASGIFGSSVYSLKSLGDYRGDNRLFESWNTFYVIQPFTGMGIAFLLYVVIRGGFLSGSGSDSSSVNQFGICAIAGLAGAFSDTAFLKLREVFQTMFKPQDDRGGKIGLKITTTALADGVVGSAYSLTLKATGGVAPLNWSVTPALPSTLTLDPTAGTITGTPTAPLAKDKFTLTVTDSATPAVSASVDLTFEIKAAPLLITTTALSEGTVGTAYSQTLQASGGVSPLKWSANPALPAPLVLEPETGSITGTPTEPLAKSKFEVTVNDSGTPAASVTAELTLEIKAAALGATQ